MEAVPALVVVVQVVLVDLLGRGRRRRRVVEPVRVLLGSHHPLLSLLGEDAPDEV